MEFPQHRKPAEADAGSDPLLGCSDMPLDTSSQATPFPPSCSNEWRHRDGGAAAASYAFSPASVSSKEAGACQGFGIRRHVVLGHGCPHCTVPEGTPGALRHGSTAMISLRHRVPGAAFCLGHFLRNVRGLEGHLTKLPAHPN